MTASAILAAVARGEASPNVFVPAIMGAGLLFSLVTILRDVVSLSSKTAEAKRAQVRGSLVAARVTDGEIHAGDVAGVAGRRTLALVGLMVVVGSAYLGINSTTNFVHDQGYLRDLAFVWGGSLVVAAAGMYIAAACFAAARRPGTIAPWSWPVLLSTPLAGTGDTARTRRMRTVIVGSLAVLTALSVLATFHHLLDPIDDRLEEVLDLDVVGRSDLARIPGSTNASIAAAIVIGIATLRCRRFAWAFIASVVVSLATTNVIRYAVDRPRPESGDKAGAVESFPSGHLLLATLLAVLLPLALNALTRSHRTRRVAAWLLALMVVFVAVVAVASDRHHTTDVIAGVALGLAVGTWASLSLVARSGHADCRDCVFRQREPLDGGT